MNEIPELPQIGDRPAIVEFARSFNGYEHFGSFEACAMAAKAKKRDDLEALRNELFFAFRAEHHTGSDILLNAFEELRPLFEEYL